MKGIFVKRDFQITVDFVGGRASRQLMCNQIRSSVERLTKFGVIGGRLVFSLSCLSETRRNQEF